ncbi:uncharacterized protein [Diabrotica undecimpunctata]|uniref:uncharacterized protein n=1 Tax=Diabrotica undecimpunctata TaxID=50387 RepID=UPI003B63DCD6
MPPVRWKAIYATIICCQFLVLVSSNSMQDPITMTSDGWRPIVGSRRQPPGFETDMRLSQYKSPRQNTETEIIKSESPITITTPESEQHEEIESSTKALSNLNAGPAQTQNTGNKIAPHSKFNSPKYQTIPPNAVSLGRPSQYGFRKHPMPAKPVKTVTHIVPAPKRKTPPRGPMGSHSTRNEVYIHPTGSLNFPYIKQGPSNVRTRETQGLGVFGTQNHFTVNQPNSHVEINRFPSLSDNVFEQYKSPGVSFIIPKGKNGQDEYSRNLVPPPPSRNLAVEKEKLKNAKIPKFKDSTAAVSEPVLEFHENYAVKPQIQDNLVHAPVVNYDQTFGLQKPFKIKHPAAIDVEVTKENLKVYHNILPNRFKTGSGDYIDYDYHTVPTPAAIPKLQTYEVTEGKWQDNPNPFTFSYLKPGDIPQGAHSHRHQQPIGPQITNEPIVELNLPPFLPTPYRPDPAYPTSPTQSEASTVFSQVSKKMNKFKNAALNNNPLFFDIKEVSTHYPILGRPAFVQEQTESPINDNEIGNEVTTQREESTTKKRRRRPQPRRPTPSTTTTTTTEEPPATEAYVPVNVNEELPAETEKPPPKRLRTRPNRYRVPTGSGAINQDIQENPIQYRTTTPSSENEENSGEKKVRGRNRYRQRGSGIKDPSDVRNSVYRKRTRPTTTTTSKPANHKMVNSEYNEPAENNGFKSKYFYHSDLETTPKPQRIVDYEEAIMSYEDKSEVSYESTSSGNLIEDIGYKGLRTTITPEETTVLNIRNPENEIDSVTVPPQYQTEEEQIVDTTVVTTIPTTTTTEALTTTKVSRIKTRPTNFKTSNRPRFSVKDYRQRLNQFTTSTPSTTTDIVKTTSEGSRIRFPARLRTRPTHSSTTTAPPPAEETTTEVVIRRRFKPKDPRHSTTTELPNIIPETNIKSVNTRLRPFDRYKTSTEASPKAKVSIKPSIYLNRRKPSINMRNKLNKPEELPVKEKEPEEKQEEDKEDSELTTEYQSVKISTPSDAHLTTLDVNEDDYSQRVSDLTSSFKSEYDTPGLFKNVAPVSRRVPNYFTISTEDPILPIEAFFPGINEKDKDT